MSDRLDYEPLRPSWWAGPSGARFRRRLIGGTIAVVGAYVLFWTLAWLAQSQDRARIKSTLPMSELSGYARDMIGEAGPGTAIGPGGGYVTSFDAFCRYVARRRPDVVPQPGAANPFPGLLTDPRYGHAGPGPTGPKDALLWSETIMHYKIGPIQLRIAADGELHDIPQFGPAVPPATRPTP